MRNSNYTLPWSRWFFAGALAGGLAAMLYVASPTLGRAFTKKNFPATKGLSGSAGIPGGVPLLW